MKVTADASSVPKSLTQAERALNSLQTQVDRATKVFAPFTDSSAAAARAQEQFAERFARLADQLRAKAVGPQEYAAAFAQLTEEAKKAADAIAEGLRVQKQYGDQTKVVAGEIERLVELERLGVIDQTALNNAAIAKLGIDKQAAESARVRSDAVAAAERQQAEAFAEARKVEEQAAAQANRERAALESEAARIRQANLNAQERFDRDVGRARVLEEAGLLTKQDFNRELQRQADLFAAATIAANKSGQAIEQAGSQGVLKFNELSGILSALPGPIGNVAGRLSGLASAGEGLSRVFSGGLQNGLASIGASVAGLVNPFTAGAAAFAAIGAGAVAAGRNLVQLEGEVERLGQLADRVGVSFSFIQVLEAAALQTGTSVEQLGGGFTKFLRAVNEARDGTKSAVEAFKNLRISTDEVRDGNPETLFQQAAQALAQMPDPAERTATAMALFGKSGAELLPVINQLGTAASDLERLGGALTDQQRADIDAFGGAMDRVGVASQGLYRQITANFAGIGTAIASNTAESIGWLNRFLKSLDDTASSKTWLGFQKSAERLKFDEEIIASRERLRKATEDLAKVQVPQIVSDGEFQAAQKLAKTFEDLKAASEDFGTNQELAAEAAGKAIDLFTKEAEAAGMSADSIKAFTESASDDFKRFMNGLDEVAKESQRAAAAEEQENAATTKAVEAVRAQLAIAIEDSARFGQAGFDAALKYQDAIVELERQFGKRIINETTLKQNAAAAAVEYQKQVEAFSKIEQLQQGIVTADAQRLTQLVDSQRETQQVETDLEFVLRQQKQLVEEIARARERGAVFAADAATARLAQLDQIQAELEEQEQALEQGFGEGFQRAFDAIDADINALINKAAEFGNAGALAAQQLKEGIARAQEQARNGIPLGPEVERLKGLFEQQLQGARNVQQLVFANLGQEQQARLQFVQQEQAARVQSAQNVAAIEREIEVTKNVIAAAREGGDLQAARAGVERLAQLNQVAQREQAIADGRLQKEQEIANSRGQQMAAAQRQQEEMARQQQALQQQYAQEQARFAEERRKAEEAEYNRQVARITELNTLGSRTVNTADIRTQEGQALVLGLAANAQDPALIEARLQTKQLQLIAQGISQAAANYFNTPVAIVGGARLAGFN